ncbi:MAG TPA: geranylgeranyl reductase family protein [Sporichthyaceae bacterium]
MTDQWDVVVVGAGPAGLNAAHAAGSLGARTLVLDRARHPRYKTCGGGMIGFSLNSVGPDLTIPIRAQVTAVSFTYRGKWRYVKADRARPALSMVDRSEFDAAMRNAVESCGVVIREKALVRSVQEPVAGGGVSVHLADGTSISARTVIGADGSAGISARHVGVRYRQTDLGLEYELPVSGALADEWCNRVHLDWGAMPGSYGWLFPKGNFLTVGVIAERGDPAGTRAYLSRLVRQLGLEHIEPAQDSGHLTRCRTADSPLVRGNVIVAGDAAGLLEPCTREGISYALRSGTLAGLAAAKAALSGDRAPVDHYEQHIQLTLGNEMEAGDVFYGAFKRHPALLHLALATPPGWRTFAKICRSEYSFERALRHRSARVGMRALRRLPSRQV